MLSKEDFSTRFVKIKNLQQNNIIVTDGEWTSSIRYIRSYPDNLDSEHQGYGEWIIYTLDGPKYLIVNRKTGFILTCDPIKRWSYDENSRLLACNFEAEWSHWGLDSPITPIGDAISYQIRSAGTGQIITGETSNQDVILKIDALDNIKQDRNNYWTFIETNKTWELPTAPILADLDPSPQYRSTGYIDLSTPERLTGWTLIPAACVEDNNRDIMTRLETSPYYILEKYQYWDNIKLDAVDARKTTTITYETDITTTHEKDLTQSVGIAINEDAGLSFSPNLFGLQIAPTYHIRKEISKNLSINQSLSNTKMQKHTTTIKFTNPLSVVLHYAKFTLKTKLVLKRMQKDIHGEHEIVTDCIFADKNIIHTATFPATDPTNGSI
ncbi:hypothetical protein [Bacillus cereus]